MLTTEQHAYVRTEAAKRAEARLNGLTPRELRQWALKGLALNERYKLYTEELHKPDKEVHGG